MIVQLSFNWINKINVVFFFCGAAAPTRVMAPSFLRFLDHTQRRTTVRRTPLDEWSARRRDLYPTTHNTHNRQTSMPPAGIRTYIPSRRAVADLRLRPRGHWDRHIMNLVSLRESLFVGQSFSFTRFLDHTQRRTTFGRISLDLWSARRRDFYLTEHNTQNIQTSTTRWDSNPQYSTCYNI